VRVRSVRHNDRKKAFEVHTSTKKLVFPFSKAEPTPTHGTAIMLRMSARSFKRPALRRLRNSRLASRRCNSSREGSYPPGTTCMIALDAETAAWLILYFFWERLVPAVGQGAE
jgi:hypothetical protein